MKNKEDKKEVFSVPVGVNDMQDAYMDDKEQYYVIRHNRDGGKSRYVIGKKDDDEYGNPVFDIDGQRHTYSRDDRGFLVRNPYKAPIAESRPAPRIGLTEFAAQKKEDLLYDRVGRHVEGYKKKDFLKEPRLDPMKGKR